MIDTKSECKHASVQPKYLDSDFSGLDEHEVRRRFPRFDGVCPECGSRMIMYSSFVHYAAGDW